MTTTLSKPSINGGGILSPEALNQFGRWNTVLVYYCSSDGWAGQKGDIELTASGATTTVSYRIHFRGGEIVDAVFDALRHPPRTRGVRLGDAPVHMPDLDTAESVLFVGASAGGSGVDTNADRIGALLRANNVACQGDTCPLDYRVVTDSHFSPERERLDYSKTTYCASNPNLCTYEGFVRTNQYAVALARDEVFDASCLEYHRTVEPGTEWKCADMGHVVRNHITTPLFVGQDLQDQLVGSGFVEEGFGTATDFGNAVESQLRELATLDATAEEGSARTGVPLARPGSWGPQCLGHELLGSSSDFYQTPVPAGSGTLSYHDTVWNWWSGASPTEVIRDFTTPGAAPGCP